MRTGEKVVRRLVVLFLLLALVDCGSLYQPRARQSPLDPYEGFNTQMRYVAMACRFYAGRCGRYAFSPEGSDEALRLAVRESETGGLPKETVDSWLQYHSTSRPGDIDFLYLNDPDAARLPPDTVMLVEKSPMERDRRLWVALLQLPGEFYGCPLLIDTRGLRPQELLGRTLSEFHVYRAMYRLLDMTTAETIAVASAGRKGLDTSLYSYKTEELGDHAWLVRFTKKEPPSMPGMPDHFAVKVDRRDARTTFLKGR